MTTKTYEKEVFEKWGNTQQYQEFSKKDKSKIDNDEMNKIFEEFGRIKTSNENSNEALTLVKKLQDCITNNYYKCSNEILKNLGLMYINDERFTKTIDSIGGDGTATFVNNAINAYCK